MKRMVFSSTIFIFAFLPAVILIHSALLLFVRAKHNVNNIPNLFLLLSSLFFYAWGESLHTLTLFICMVFNYLIGRAIDRSSSAKFLLLGAGVGLNIALLFYFKYAMLFIRPHIHNLNEYLPAQFAIDRSFEVLLPLGISFYVFQAMSYLIDVFRRQVTPSSNIIEFGCYLTMFPQLIAGPIVRYSQVRQELRKRAFSLDSFTEGVSLFISGLAKKVLIADTLGKVADAAFAVPSGELSGSGAWIGITCYTFQIYYDFSGYSDMAIGIGKMLGFSFPQNFNYPYIANSIKNFWQRWHMSLSSWFKDYLYIPLGGNRRGRNRTYINLFLVFALCGFWHGANWTFMAWGCYYGVFLVLERVFPQLLKIFPRIVKHIYVILIIMLGWVLFRADTFEQALMYYKSLLYLYEGGIEMNRVWLVSYGNDVAIALFGAVIFSFPVVPKIREALGGMQKDNLTLHNLYTGLYYCAMLVLLLITCMPIFGASYSAFIYFRF